MSTKDYYELLMKKVTFSSLNPMTETRSDERKTILSYDKTLFILQVKINLQ